MQDGARAHTANDTMSLLRSQRYLEILEPDMWPPNSPDLNPVDFCIWGVLAANVYRGRMITGLEQLKEAIVEEWEKFPQETINRAIEHYRKRLRRVIEQNGGHIERYNWQLATKCTWCYTNQIWHFQRNLILFLCLQVDKDCVRPVIRNVPISPERFFASFIKMATKYEKNIFFIQFFYRRAVIYQILTKSNLGL